MREIRLHGSEGGAAQANAPFLPLSNTSGWKPLLQTQVGLEACTSALQTQGPRGAQIVKSGECTQKDRGAVFMYRELLSESDG